MGQMRLNLGRGHETGDGQDVDGHASAGYAVLLGDEGLDKNAARVGHCGFASLLTTPIDLASARLIVNRLSDMKTIINHHADQ